MYSPHQICAFVALSVFYRSPNLGDDQHLVAPANSASKSKNRKRKASNESTSSAASVGAVSIAPDDLHSVATSSAPKKSTNRKRKESTASSSTASSVLAVPAPTGRAVHVVSVNEVLQKLNSLSAPELVEAVLVFARAQLQELPLDHTGRLSQAVLDYLDEEAVRPRLAGFIHQVYIRLVNIFAECGTMKLHQFQRLTEKWYGVTQAPSIFHAFLAVLMPPDLPHEQCASFDVVERSARIFSSFMRGIYHLFSSRARVESNTIKSGPASGARGWRQSYHQRATALKTRGFQASRQTCTSRSDIAALQASYHQPACYFRQLNDNMRREI